MMAEDPVWITGVGLATPLGCDLATLEANLLAGRSGVAVVTSFCTTDYPSRIAAELVAVPAPRAGNRSPVSRPAAARAARTLVRSGASRMPACGTAGPPGESAWCLVSGRNGCRTGKPTSIEVATDCTTRRKTPNRRSSASTE